MSGFGGYMAKFKCEGIELYIDQLEKLEKHTISVMKQGTFDGAAIVADEVKSRLKSVIRHPTESTGALVNSMYLAKMKDENGYVYTEIGFAGYDPDRKPTKGYPHGVPNIIKARAMESGTSRQKKTPFIRPAFNAAKEKCMAAMQKTVDKEIEKIMGE